ncbi:hypothetical protein OXX79_014284, partial [Metschnikowia pulcherrima]
EGFTPQFKTALDKLSEKAAADSSVVDRANQESSATGGYIKEIASFIPKGFEVVNDAIHFGETVALNVMPLFKKSSEAKSVLKPSSENVTVYTDADSQALFFVSEETELEADEIADESQAPSLVKVWANKPAVLSFEDCTASDALHEERLSENL